MFESSEKIDAICLALSKFQLEVPSIPKSGVNPRFNSKYATLDDIVSLVSPCLARFNLFLNLAPINDGEMVGVRVAVYHASGQFLATRYLIKPARSGDPQAVGAILTYFSRYGIMGMLGLGTGEEDDDGNRASHSQAQQSRSPEVRQAPKAQNQPVAAASPKVAPTTAPKAGIISEAQAKRLFAISKQAGWTHNEVKELCYLVSGVSSSKDIPRSDYEEICTVVSSKSLDQFKEELGGGEERSPKLPDDVPTLTDDDIPF